MRLNFSRRKNAKRRREVALSALQNFGVAFCYNIIAVPFAMAGYVTPLIAAIVMSTLIDPRHGQCGAPRGRTKIMTALAWLIPAALFLGGLGLVDFLCALRSGQFEDLEGASYRALEDDPPGLASRSAPLA
jgi:cbb3-type cytochrome oxidase maturation protein